MDGVGVALCLARDCSHGFLAPGCPTHDVPIGIAKLSMLWMMDWWSQGWDPVRKLQSVSQVKAQLGDFSGNPVALFCHRSFLPMLLNPVGEVVISPFFLGTLRLVKAATQRLSLPFPAVVASITLHGDCQLVKYWSAPLPTLGRPKAGLGELVGSLCLSLSLSAGVNEDLINAGTLAQVPFSRL